MNTNKTALKFFFASELALLTLAVGCQPAPGPSASQLAPNQPASTPPVATVTSEAQAALVSPPTALVPGIASDGFSTGQDTAEGAACDFARSFIETDAAKFRAVCYPATNSPAAYRAFLDNVVTEINQAKQVGNERVGGPKSILKVFVARSLTKAGPASAGYAIFGLSAVEFVDVDQSLWGGKTYTNRTLVVQGATSKKWFVIPDPDTFPMLSQGLNYESPSTKVWTPHQAAPK